MGTDGMDWKLCAKNRAERLAHFIEMGSPEVLIGSSWFLLWQAMQNAYGSDVFEQAQSRWGDIRASIDLDN
jgi:hypothetical protein